MPVGPSMVVPESGQLAWADAAFGGTQHKISQLACEGSGAQSLPETRRPHGLVAFVQQFADHEILLGPGQQSRRRLPELRRGPPEQAERVPMEGPHDGLGRDATATGHIGPDKRGLDTSAKCGGTAASERQHHDARRIDARRHARGDRRDQQGGLAGPRSAAHQQRTAIVSDHRRGRIIPAQLVGRGLGRRREPVSHCRADQPPRPRRCGRWRGPGGRTSHRLIRPRRYDGPSATRTGGYCSGPMPSDRAVSDSTMCLIASSTSSVTQSRSRSVGLILPSAPIRSRIQSMSPCQ